MFAKNEVNPLISRIRDVFYNGMAEFALSDEGFDLENINIKFKEYIQNIILKILFLSKNSTDTLHLSNGVVLREQNCPIVYQTFFKALIFIKNNNKGLILDETTTLLDLSQGIVMQIQLLADKLMEFQAFQQMFPQLKDFILEAKGILTTPPLRQLDETGITTQLIRTTFYNEMVSQGVQAVMDELITHDDLESQEASIYFALPGLTILEAIYQSRNCKGIELLEGKMVTQENCPQEDNFPLLMEIILAGKQMMKPLFENQGEFSNQELLTIKYLCLSRENDLPAQLQQFITDRTAQCASIINKLSSQISQRKIFHGMVERVIETVLEALPKGLDLS